MSESNGQKPITGWISVWIILLVLGWAANSVIIKLIVRDIPPFCSAFLRFGMAFPLLAAFLMMNKIRIRINIKELGAIACLALLTYTQISLFNSGSQHTTGGRIALFIFSYPLMVPILAHFVIKEERLRKRALVGCLLAFIGLLLPLHHSLVNDTSTLQGDIMQLGSAISLVFLVVFTKKIISWVNKWKVIFWQTIIATILFLLTALLFEEFDFSSVQPTAFYAIIYQAVVINTLCFLSYQYILSKHNSSQVSVFFFATPLLGMLLGVLILNETFEFIVLAGCLFVGAGIYITNAKKGTVRKSENVSMKTEV